MIFFKTSPYPFLPLPPLHQSHPLSVSSYLYLSFYISISLSLSISISLYLSIYLSLHISLFLSLTTNHTKNVSFLKSKQPVWFTIVLCGIV